jgi:hypothetical protein
MPVYRDAGFELYDAGITSSAFDDEKDPEREPGHLYTRGTVIRLLFQLKKK